VSEGTKRDYKMAVPSVLIWAALLGLLYWWKEPSTVTMVVIGSALAPLAAVLFLMLSYDGEGSRLYGLKVITERLPAINKPEGHVHFKTKMIWVFAILTFYFILCNVFIYGLGDSMDMFAQYRAILAGASGSLMHLGIGPIVTGSIIMQLFVGAKIIGLDLSNDKDKSMYQGTQKLLVLIMIFVESVPQVFGFLAPELGFVNWMDELSPGNGELIADVLIVTQLIFGSYLVFLMDEVVSKWGIGSGISLFIAGGVAEATFTGSFNWMPSEATQHLDIAGAGGCPPGAFPKTWYLFHNLPLSGLTQGGYERILIYEPNPLISVFGTVVVFLIVAFFESTRVEIPLSHDKARGARGRYPIKLIYASNIPVILVAALLANVSMFTLLFWSNPTLSEVPLIGGKWWIGYYPPGETAPTAGAAWYLSSIHGVGKWLLPLMSDRYADPNHSRFQIIMHLIIYMSVMIFGSILFAKFWIETTNMGPEAVAKQIGKSGMQVPGFRREPRILKKVLERYIPPVTILSGAIVGALAGGADLVGTVGNVSGTGVLLAVGIMIQFYEAMGREQMMEMHPVLRGFFGSQ